MVYRSRAVRALSAAELHELMSAAQRRNGREAITGLMLYDNDSFFQWLEGPPDGVGRVMDSIRTDARHTDIEILDDRCVQARRFADWSMKLATPRPVLASWRRDVIEPPPEIVETLRRRPEAAPRLLLALVPSAVPEDGTAEATGDLPLGRKAADILKELFVSTVLPQMLGEAAGQPASGRAAAHPRAAELAELLVAADQDAVLQLVGELRGAGALAPLYATLLEPAARRLGDLWSEDICSEFDVTLGLCRLQTAVRLLGTGAARTGLGVDRPVVLIAPEPGELHRLGAALDSDVLRLAGWAPHCAYPTDDQALHDLLASAWFDVLDLSLSTAFRREHRLPQVTDTIAQARRASRNPALVVVVGGRVFREERGAGRRVGADHALATASEASRSILRTMVATRSLDLVATSS